MATFVNGLSSRVSVEKSAFIGISASAFYNFGKKKQGFDERRKTQNREADLDEQMPCFEIQT